MIMKQSRPPLVTMSYASHWLKFLLKDAVKDPSPFPPPFKYSGKIKTEVRICSISNLYFLLFFVENIWHRNIFKSQIQTFAFLWHGRPVLFTDFEDIPANNLGSLTEARTKIQEILE